MDMVWVAARWQLVNAEVDDDQRRVSQSEAVTLYVSLIFSSACLQKVNFKKVNALLSSKYQLCKYKDPSGPA